MPTLLLFVSVLSAASSLTAAPSVSEPSLTNNIQQSGFQDASLENRIAELKGKIAENPNDPDLHFELSQLYEENVDRYYDESLAEFKIAVDRGLKGKTVIWNTLGDVNAHAGALALAAGNYDKAIRNFEAALKSNPNHYAMYNNIGFAYFQKNEFARAVEYQRKAIDLSPVRAVSYEGIGMLFLESKDFRLSILNLNRFMYLDDSSKNMKAFFNIAQAYHGLGEYARSIEALDQLPRKLKKDDTVKAFRDECKQPPEQSQRK